MPPTVSETVFTDDEILEVFPNRSVVVSTQELWEIVGSPVGKRALLNAAKRDLPPAYASREEAIAAKATPGERSAHLLAKASMAVFANRKGLKPGSRLAKLESDFNEHLPEFFRLCGITPPS